MEAGMAEQSTSRPAAVTGLIAFLSIGALYNAVVGVFLVFLPTQAIHLITRSHSQVDDLNPALILINGVSGILIAALYAMLTRDFVNRKPRSQPMIQLTAASSIVFSLMNLPVGGFPIILASVVFALASRASMKEWLLLQ